MLGQRAAGTSTGGLGLARIDPAVSLRPLTEGESGGTVDGAGFAR